MACLILRSSGKIKEEFRRITAVPLEQTFISKLDGYTPKLMELLKAKGVKIYSQHSKYISSQGHTIEKQRDGVIRSLTEYLRERAENLFKDGNDGSQEDFIEHVMMILVHGSSDGEPVVSIVLEGSKVLSKCESTAKACALLMGLIYAINLQYPSKLKYTFLDLDGLKCSPKVWSLKYKLLT
ncbi:hypothetical protein QTP70_028326 [Hemibagrus guttatus]|uniref:Uncharacterized protein n=1 Tax=Hemibagrus guttatus TaxID=175788 RepID=A0AAE0URR5_9TELE|nr:hypothetical protein QTP70_028326 [Hemibagrus guttatus]KAK3539178.1 hypothetical protein QTP86_028668 [Hemibagrus guttatus]